MEHRICGGKIAVSELKQQQKVTLKCLLCGKVWYVFDNFDDIKDDEEKRDTRKPSVFLQYAIFHKNTFLNFLFNYRLTRLAKMVSVKTDNCIGLDIGCQGGYFSNYLAELINRSFIGIDVDKLALNRAQLFTRLRSKLYPGSSDLEFVLADINHLPFRENSFQVVVCGSVLEHVKNLGKAMEQISNVLENNGSFVAGYPIETDLFITLVRLIQPDWMNIRDPKIVGQKKFLCDPDTHKQSFVAIRKVLQQHFLIVKREKSFFTVLPDYLSWYECAAMQKAIKS